MGGTFLSQNKVRPGPYINFTAVAKPSMTVGDRGIATMAIPLNWGSQDALIDVYSTDLTDGSSLAAIGVTAFDEDAKLLNLMLSNSYLARIYRLDTGGEKATATIGGITATAKYTGTFGNKITISVVEADGVFTVTTFVDGASKDAQAITTVSELVANDFVTWGGEGTITVNAGAPLKGGTNGTVTPDTAYPAYLALARKARWQVMALTQDNAAFAPQFATFADQMRYEEGKFVQVVLANYSGADSVSVINSDCGAIVNGLEVTAEEATAWVAGITAGASIIQSNVAKKFRDATRILNERTNAEIIEALKRGMFILSTNQRGEIVVEDDINSLHTFTDKLSEDFKLNQIVRVLDEIGTTASDTWEQRYMGTVQNNENGRLMYKSDLLSYFTSLQSLGAIDEFAGADDIEVIKGTAKDSVVVNIWVYPVSAMSKLYMTVYVR